MHIRAENGEQRLRRVVKSSRLKTASSATINQQTKISSVSNNDENYYYVNKNNNNNNKLAINTKSSNSNNCNLRTKFSLSSSTIINNLINASNINDDNNNNNECKLLSDASFVQQTFNNDISNTTQTNHRHQTNINNINNNNYQRRLLTCNNINGSNNTNNNNNNSYYKNKIQVQNVISVLASRKQQQAANKINLFKPSHLLFVCCLSLLLACCFLNQNGVYQVVAQLSNQRISNVNNSDEPTTVSQNYMNVMQQQLSYMQAQCPILASANPRIIGMQQSNLNSNSNPNNNNQNEQLRGNCPLIRDNMLNVHIICHTHLDTGWVETFEQYYFSYVQTIINSVVKSLHENPRRRFIFVETSFLMRWWRDQNDYTRSRFKKLVLNGQLEFISGGWSMNDEAVSHYTAVIDQMTLGHKNLYKMFGQCGGIPRVGWQIDPFGHSREFASLLSQMGFDGLFLGRIDFQDKLFRQNMQTMEFVWKSSPSLGAYKSDLFTSILPNTYSPPEHFCFDVHCTDEQLNRYNIQSKAMEFAKLMMQQSEFYATNHTIVTMGMDFHYRDANKWYSNLDLLIDEIQSNQQRYKINLVYSTPSCYLKAIHKQTAATAWPVKLDDFFPYADAHNSYWTGYFTSRPGLKYQIELGNNFLQAAKQLSVLANPIANQEAVAELEPLQEALGILQHHDAVTGTCKQFVNDDYSHMLASAMKKAHHSLVTSVAKIIEHSNANRQLISRSSGMLNGNGNGNNQASSIISPPMSKIDSFIMKGEHIFCSSLNASHCQISEKLDKFERLLVHAYNPASHSVQHYVQIPVRDGRYAVRDASAHSGLGAYISSVQQTDIPQPVLRLTSIESRQDYGVIDPDVSKELMFPAILAPLALTTFVIEKLPMQIGGNNPSSAAAAALSSSLLPRFAASASQQYFQSLQPVAAGASSFASIGRQHQLPPLPPPSALTTSFNLHQQQQQQQQQSNHANFMRRESLINHEDIVIGNGRLSVIIDGFSGLMKAVQLPDGRRMALRQNMLYYDADGRIRQEKNSGAYIFNPSERGTQKIARGRVEVQVMRGPVLEEVQQVFSPWCSQVIRVYKNSDYVEFHWLVGPIPLQADINGNSGTSSLNVENGREIVSLYETDMKTNGTFFTDSNGRETIRRLRDHRSDFRLFTSEYTASNYYPVTSWIFIRDYDRNLQLSLLPDRPQGGSSIRDGQLELMLHRRLLQDDSLGVDEPLNEPGIDRRGLIIRGKHYLLAGPIDSVIRSTRQLSKQLHMKPIQWFQAPPTSINLQHQPASLVGSFGEPAQVLNSEHLSSTRLSANGASSVTDTAAATSVGRFKFSGLRDYLPKMINLLSLESWDVETILIRLEHIFEINEDADLSRPVQLSLKHLFRDFKIVKAREMSLNGMQDIEVARVNRLRFQTATNPYKNYTDELADFVNMDFVTPLHEAQQGGEDLLIVELRPMEIRTFLCQIAYS